MTNFTDRKNRFQDTELLFLESGRGSTAAADPLGDFLKRRNRKRLTEKEDA